MTLLRDFYIYQTKINKTQYNNAKYVYTSLFSQISESSEMFSFIDTALKKYTLNVFPTK